MKKVIAGVGSLVAGSILFLASYIAAGMFAPSIGEWDTNAGRFWQAVAELGLIPTLVFSVLFMGIGIALIAMGMREEPPKK